MRHALVPRRARAPRTDAARARSNAVLAGLPAPGKCRWKQKRRDIGCRAVPCRAVPCRAVPCRA
eukprot:1466307-Prymnesium_polylepis.1